MTARENLIWGAVGMTALALAATLGPGCGGSSASSPGPQQTYGGYAGKSGSGGTGRGGAAAGVTPGSGGGSGVPLPPETEVESSFEAPVATGRYVWVANPASGRVAYIDASTLAVKTAEAGNAPTTLGVVPGATDTVIVLNRLSHDATLMQAAAGGQLAATMISGIAPLANAWAISPDGRVAIAWTDSRAALADPKRKDSLEGFQDLTVIDLAARPPAATTLAVGYRPVSITFARGGREAFVVTGDGVSVVALPAATPTAVPPTGGASAVAVTREVALSTDPSETADGRDVNVTSAGLAVVRRDGSSEVRLVDLTTGMRGAVAMSGPVTDVDVTPDGARAVAVVRQTSEIAIMPLATALSAPETVLREVIDGELVGSVVLTSDASTAVLFSNATDAERLTVVDVATGTYRILPVHAPVLSVEPTPDGRFAVIVHKVASAPAGSGGSSGTSGPSGNATSAAVAANAFSVIPLDGSRSGRIQETVAPPNAIAIAAGSDRALVTVRDDKGSVFGAYVVGIPSLDITTVGLGSPPIATGVAAEANRGFVAQSHPEGRITFIPFAAGEPQTLTGFDLAARVVDGVAP